MLLSEAFQKRPDVDARDQRGHDGSGRAQFNAMGPDPAMMVRAVAYRQKRPSPCADPPPTRIKRAAPWENPSFQSLFARFLQIFPFFRKPFQGFLWRF